MSDKLIKKYEEEYAKYLGRPWKKQKGGGCFTLLYDMGVDLGYHECKEDYSFSARQFMKDLWEGEDWECIYDNSKDTFSTDSLKVFDLLLMDFTGKRVSHGAAYIGDGYMIHHKAYDVSKVEKINTYIPLIRYVIRKKND